MNSHKSADSANHSGHASGEFRRPLDADTREAWRDRVALAAEVIPLNWPLRSFAYRNPLMGFEALPFEEAVTRAKSLLGGEGYLSLAEYRACHAQGRISEHAVLGALHARSVALAAEPGFELGTRKIHLEDLLLMHLAHGIDRLDPKLLTWQLSEEDAAHRFRVDVPANTRARLSAHARGPEAEATYINALWTTSLALSEAMPPPAEGNEGAHPAQRQSEADERTVSEIVDALEGSELRRLLDEQMIKWCAAFTDEAMADWSMPGRTQGFYRAWRDLAAREPMGVIAGIRDWTRVIAALPDNAEEALASSLERLGVSEEESLAYLRRHLAQLPGWAGFIRWRDRNPDYAAQHDHPIDPVEYLAVRLNLELALADAQYRRRRRALAPLPELRRRLQSQDLRDFGQHHEDAKTARICAEAWRLFHIAQFFGLPREDFQQLTPGDARRMLAWLDRFPTEVLRPIWQAAYEVEYRNGLLGKLVEAQSLASKKIAAAGHQRPRAHAVFCIDARSEPFRRNLEAQGDYATLGFAGFFATPIFFRGMDSDDEKLLCPVLIKPKYGVREMPRVPDAADVRRHQLGDRWHRIASHLFHQIKANPASSFLTFDVLGFLFGIALLGKTILIKLYEPLRSGLRQWCVPPIATRIPVDRPPHSHTGHTSDSHRHAASPSSAAQNFSSEEQVAVTENALRVMSLTREFARIILLCGHASTTENNPYASAYHCGACGGNPGGPNARVLASLANKQLVREALQARGIDIPADTWFIAGEHNTTTDEVSLFDLEEVPTTHHPDVDQLRRDLATARLLNARERCSRLPGAPEHLSASDAARHTWRLSRDWAQIRPEWGLSSNAAFVIGRRRLTRDLDLGGRVFLHNYDQSQDETGKVLESIMTAPLVVVQMINFQYYFSATDHWVYGSGTKVLHNVVSGVGVMLGRNSDLQTGFPFQALTTGARRYHEPLRLMAVLEADPARISGVIAKHTVLQNFFDNEWVTLVSCAPMTGALAQYLPGGQWNLLTVASA